jgi:hypothetical protein
MNESELAEFQRGHLVPIGRVQGQQIIHGKPVSILQKALRAMTKPTAKVKSRKSSTKSRGKTRGIESDNKVHFQKQNFKPSDFY